MASVNMMKATCAIIIIIDFIISIKTGEVDEMGEHREKEDQLKGPVGMEESRISFHSTHYSQLLLQQLSVGGNRNRKGLLH